MKLSLAFLACTLALISMTARADDWVIEHVTLIDGIHPPQADMTVAVAGERIAGVAPSAVAHAFKGRRISGIGKFLIPGLIDVHIHLRGGFDVGGKVDAEPGPPNREEGLAALASFLYSGVTTVFDAGNRAEHILPLRADERAGKILSPRIFATGNLITYPGSHGDKIAVRISDFEKDKALLDKHIAEQQPDILKLTLEEEGWGSRPMIPLLPVELLEKITRYYNQHGIRTTVHVSSELRALEAIYAGSDTLAHPVIQAPVSDSFVKLMGAKKIPFASTLTIGENYSRLAEHPEYLDQPLYVASLTAAEREQLKTKTRAEWQARPWTWWMKIMTPIAEENVRKIHAAGGVVACGTDQSSGPATQRELELLVASGISPLDTIRIATYNGAVFLGKADQFGSVDTGKFADLVMLAKDPTVDINNAKAIVFVMKNGRLIDESQLPLAGGKQRRRFTGI
ncbi:MAG TPA: amidohydrolase family protein [Steroidobacteraceae bacterium]|jgi:imidazolonepropionase-like amidohydrolase|nr:amidohydrolase family protein [Steroidobacteraceae bacterium]